MVNTQFVEIAHELETVGLLWQPEIGDEIYSREASGQLSVLVDTAGLTPKELRENFLWLPTVEQMVLQIEVRQGILFHAGLELTDTQYCYKTVIHARGENLQGMGLSLRNALGIGLRDFLIFEKSGGMH